MASEIRKEPTLYSLEHLINLVKGEGELRGVTGWVEIDGRWFPARPIGFQGSAWRRFKIAWEVFTGRADAVVWPAGQ
jgi:hypothetical protein